MIVGGLLPTHRVVYDSRWHGQLMGWLASFTLEDEAILELGLPWAVCEYENFFVDELLGLPIQRDVDFTVELHLVHWIFL